MDGLIKKGWLCLLMVWLLFWYNVLIIYVYVVSLNYRCVCVGILFYNDLNIWDNCF